MFDLTISMLGYWHAGTGRSAGTRVDAIVEKDVYGLPVISGRTLKGLLRDAAYTLEEAPWFRETFGENVTALVFGTRGDGDVERAAVRAGVIRVGDARLPEAERSWLAGTDEGRQLIQGFYRETFSTAIDHRSGCAMDKSLRGMEVTIPCSLRARIDIIPVSGADAMAEAQRQWAAPGRLASLLQTIIPLVDAVGAKRSRGYGRARLQLEVVA